MPHIMFYSLCSRNITCC